MKSIPFFIFSLFLFIKLQSQALHDKVWVQGAYDVYSTTFTSSTTSNAFIDSTLHYYFGHGNSNICDQNGNLKLLCNGFFIFDKNLQLLDNGDSIVPREIILKEVGFSSYSQASLFLPFANGKYYLFTPTASDSEVIKYWNVPMSGRASFDQLLYHVIDMNANGGAGRVVRKGVPLLQDVNLSKTNMMACKHGNGTDYWLFKQGNDSNYVYKFLVTQDSIYNYGTQGFPGFRFGKWDQGGQAMFSQDGNKYAVCIRGGGDLSIINPPAVTPGKFFVADFDRCNGMLSNPMIYQTKPSSCQNPFDTTCKENFTEGLCFSPNGRFIYIASYWSIKQLDLWDTDTSTQWSYIHGLDTSWDATQDYSSMYLGPDNKLYIGNWNGLSKQMSVIEDPDIKGVGCNFCARCLRFPSYGVTSPPCMANYRLGAAPIGGNCWPLANNMSMIEQEVVELFPNPADDIIHLRYKIESGEEGRLDLVDMLGQVRRSFSLSSNLETTIIQVKDLPSGIYLYSFYIGHLRKQTGKIILK